MPLDVRGRIRATIKAGTCVRALPQRVREPAVPPPCQGLGLVIFAREPGILSRRKSPAHAAQVPALCTHHGSLPSLSEGRIAWSHRRPALGCGHDRCHCHHKRKMLWGACTCLHSACAAWSRQGQGAHSLHRAAARPSAHACCATSNLSSSGQPQLRNYPGFLQ